MNTVSLHTTFKTLLAGIAAAGLFGAARAQVPVTSDIAVSTTWTANNVYALQNQIYVLPGATLTIQAGTVIASTAGSLAVCKGAQIFVQGTESNPVVMTSTADRATWTAGDPRTGHWREAANEWGNLTLMGAAYISENAVPANTPAPNPNNVGAMEGLIAAFPGDTKVLYGGGNDDDDSGSISYVSLRYGGRVIGLNNELNGLSLGGIGRETDIHHVEVMNNVDDGVEIFGGTVNLGYFSIWNIGDDSFDIDQGWRGKAQFVLIVQGYSLDAPQGSGVGDNCFETDGAEDSDYQPVTTGAIYNCTVIGQPLDGDQATAWRDNARVQYHNCIFMDIGDQVVAFDNVDGDGAHGYGFNGTLTWQQTWTTPYTATSTVNAPANPAAFYRAQTSGNLAEIKDTVFFDNLGASAYTEANARGVFAAANDNVTASASPIQSITRGPAVVKGGKVMVPVIALDPRPANDALTSAGFAPHDGFFQAAHYRGAFAPGNNWLAGWTASEAFGFTPSDGWCDLGSSLGGVHGAPVLSGAGTLAAGTSFTLTGSNARESALAILAMGFGRLGLPLFGGTLVPDFNTFGTVLSFTNGSGQMSLGIGPIPPGFATGTPFYFQYGVLDPAAPQGIAFSNAIVKRFP